MNKNKIKTPGVNKSKKATIGTKIVGGVILTAFAALTTTSFVASFKNFDATLATLKGQPVYTQEQADNYSKEKNKENVVLINTLSNKLDVTKTELETQQQINANNVNLLQQKQAELTAKATELSTLQVENAENKGKITAYETQINNLKEQLKTAIDSGEADEQTILSLNSQINTLTTEKQNLENVNASNQNTINSLNSQVLNLNNTVTELTNSINANLQTIQTLNAKVSELQESIKYYELLIAGYNFEDKAVVTFKYNGTVHSLSVIDKGSSLTTTTPTDTDYIKFNYWQTEDGTQIDLTTFKPTENVTLIANLTYYYDVKYFDGESEYTSNIVEAGQTGSNLQLTNTTEKRFVGWSLDNVNVVDPTTITISENTNFYALWEYSKEVKFLNGTEQIGETQYAFNSSTLTVPTVSKDGYNFLGWTIDGTTIVDLTNYQLTTNVVFKAKFELIEYILTFVDENNQTFETFNYSIENNNINVAAPTKSGYTFTYFSKPTGERVNLSELVVNGDITLKANYLYNNVIGTYYVKKCYASSDYDSPVSGKNYMLTGYLYTLTITTDGKATIKKVFGGYNNRSDTTFAEIFTTVEVTYNYINFNLTDADNRCGSGSIQSFGYYTGTQANQVFVEELKNVYTFTFDNESATKYLTLTNISGTIKPESSNQKSFYFDNIEKDESFFIN